MCPISIRALYLKNQLDQLSSANSEHQHALRRRAQEFRVLYHATKESLVTSFLLYLPGSLSLLPFWQRLETLVEPPPLEMVGLNSLQ